MFLQDVSLSMEETKKKTTRNKVDNAKKIIESYMDYVLTHGHRPPSVFQFMKGLKLREDKFYDHFGSFNTLEKEIWRSFLRETITVLDNDESFNTYSAREKLLAFYFTLVEVLRNERSYVAYSFGEIKRPELTPSFLKGFRDDFLTFVQGILNEGMSTEEIIQRPVLADRYKDGLWLQLIFVINFWLKDESKKFVATDAAIEKSVNLSFELMGRGPLDAMIDFAKFLFHNR